MVSRDTHLQATIYLCCAHSSLWVVLATQRPTPGITSSGRDLFQRKRLYYVCEPSESLIDFAESAMTTAPSCLSVHRM
jgi:hypothetical protein